LDFGCGVGFSLVLGKLYNIEVVGLDIPIYKGENPIYSTQDAQPSPFLKVQKKLVSAGYRVVLRDTVLFPWEEFEDNEFEFITFFFSIIKNFGDDENLWDLNKRLHELVRITKPNGSWHIEPKRHIRTILREAPILKKVRICSWGADKSYN
jgi:SAM-dependent methyltransferase